MLPKANAAALQELSVRVLAYVFCPLFLVGAVLALSASGRVPAGSVPPEIDHAEKEATQWLLGQMVPDDVVPAPDPDRRRLLLSYRVPPQDPSYRYTYGRSFVYDDALGAIALTMVGRYREAEFLLNALRHLLRPDGSLWFAYNTQNSWPDDKDSSGAVVRMGSVAWVGYAFTYYLSTREKENPGFVVSDPLGREYASAARSIASFLLANQVTDPADPRYGLVTGGLGASTVTISNTSGRPAEVYTPQKVLWVSMEHNVDAWFFLRDLSRLIPDSRLTAAAGLIAERLSGLWSDTDGQFRQGIHEDRTPDTALPLDGASWGAIFLLAEGRADLARRCAEGMRTRFGSELKGLRGYRPYGPEPVYEDQRVNRFFFPEASRKLWQDLPFIWGEGSLGAAVALARLGNPEEALSIMDSLRHFSAGGGIRYASSTVQYLFSDSPSVASTSWFIIAAETLRGAPSAGSFWGP